ncbi:MAG: redox-sensing transcriptional repressor Rex [candidate division Zixibacteria bacterium]|nr:redox-sensing transcriptional repressor Rex [candidate division Zixibacteria bacterium]
MLTTKKVSESTIYRLSIYYRALATLKNKNIQTISSKELAKREKLTPAQVRKDLSFFGSFGTRGLGYPVNELINRIAEILGLNRLWNVALIGLGNIGSALVSYKEFAKQGFNIKLLFDNDQRKIGSNNKGIIVSDFKDFKKLAIAENIDMVIIAVPIQAAQSVANDVVEAGIKAIMNFVPVNLELPDDIILRNQNMCIELEHLSFALTNKINKL